MSFGSVSRAYERAALVSIYMVYAAVDEISSLAGAQSELRRLVTDGDEDLREVLDAIHFALYRLATNVLPPAHDGLGLAHLVQITEAASTEVHLRTRLRGVIEVASSALQSLMAKPSTALTQEVMDALDSAPPDDRLLVLPQSRNVGATEAHLTAIGLPTRVTSANQLRKAAPAEVTVCVGSPSLFPAAVWNASRADSVCFVAYPLGGRSVPSGGLFGDEGGLKTSRFRESGVSDRIEGVTLVSPEEAYYLEAGQRLIRSLRPVGSELVEAQLLLLEGGNAVWMSSGDADWMWAVEFVDDLPEIRQVSPSNMEAGIYVIFRDQGATSDLVRTVADAKCGASRFRAVQHRWKSELAKAVSLAGGPRAAAEQIRRLGATTANPSAWIGERSIRPHAQSDFRAACRFAGLADESEPIWQALTQIKRAHLRAGQLIRKQLEQALIDDGGQRLSADGVLRLDVEGLGRLSAYRVVFKHPETHVISQDEVDRPFIAEELGWPE